MPITKPSVQRPWADSGTKTPPSDGRRNTGYVLNDIPTRAELNALLFEVTEAYRYLMKVGVALWDANETYGLNDRVVDPADARVYQLTNLTGLVSSTIPSNAPDNWSQFGMRLKADRGDYANPLSVFRDAGNRPRLVLDHYGLLTGGRIRQWHEVWDRDGAGLFGSTQKWSQTLNGGTIVNQGPTGGGGGSTIGGQHYRTMVVTPLLSATNSTLAEETFPNLVTGPDTMVVLETTMALDTVGTAKSLFKFGVATSFGGGNEVSLFKGSGDLNWRFGVPGVSAIDTGIAVAADTQYRVRIELIGANIVDTGSTPRANLFINDTPFHIDNPIADASFAKVLFGGTRQVSGGADERMAVGPIACTEVMFPNSSVLY